MRVLVLVNELDGLNGYSTYAKNIVDSLIENGHVVDIAVSSVNANYDHKRQHVIFSQEAFAYTWRPFLILKAARNLSLLLDKIKPDVVHVVNEQYVMPFAFVSRVKAKVILTIHGTYSYLPAIIEPGFRRYIGRLIFMRAYRKVDRIISVSEKTKRRHESDMGLSKPIKVIHNSIDIQPGGRVKRSFTAPYHVLTVGAVKARKGIIESIELLQKWATLRKKAICYHVVGNCNEGSSYIEKVKLKVENCENDYFRVIMHGKIPHSMKSQLFKKAVLYTHIEPKVNSRKVEGFGIGIIEAAAYGIPSLVGKGTATEEAIIEGKTGYAVSVDDVQHALSCLDSILIKQALHQDALEGWAHMHSRNVVFKEIEAVYLS